MSYEELKDREVRTRKDHHCVWCPEPIPKGTLARYRVYKFDGDFVADYMHPECYWAMLATDNIEDGWTESAFKRGTRGDCDY